MESGVCSNQQRRELLLTKQASIACIIPCFNEGALIKEFLVALFNQLKTITSNLKLIVIDDGSTDDTLQQVLNLKKTLDTSNSCSIKLIQLSRNFGKEAALLSGLEFCTTEHDNAIAIIIDADFQHPIELIPTMLEHWSNGFDMVYGVRSDRHDELWLKRILTKWFYALMRSITKIKITPHAGDFRLLDQKIVVALSQCKEKNRFTKGLYNWVGFKSCGIEFKAYPRKTGKSTFGFTNLTELAITGITSFSNAPLRIWSLLGLLISSVAFLYALFIIIKTIIYGVELPGYASLMIAIMFFGGIQLFSIGVLGEYIAKIFNEVKQRPNYIIKDIFD